MNANDVCVTLERLQREADTLKENKKAKLFIRTFSTLLMRLKRLTEGSSLDLLHFNSNIESQLRALTAKLEAAKNNKYDFVDRELAHVSELTRALEDKIKLLDNEPPDLSAVFLVPPDLDVVATATPSSSAGVTKKEPAATPKPAGVKAEKTASKPKSEDGTPEWLSKEVVDKVHARLTDLSEKNPKNKAGYSNVATDLRKTYEAYAGLKAGDPEKVKKQERLYNIIHYPDWGYVEDPDIYRAMSQQEVVSKYRKVKENIKKSNLEGTESVTKPMIESLCGTYLSMLRRPGEEEGKELGAELGVSSVFCIDGPPGTGKTTVAKAVADALDIGFYDLSMAGKNNSEIVYGYSQQYATPAPGICATAQIKCGRQRVALLFDETDKSGLEVKNALGQLLEKKQTSYKDNYFDADIDKRKIVFILTTNDFSALPLHIQSRVKKLYLGGYDDPTKEKIVRNMFKENMHEQRSDTFMRVKTFFKSDEDKLYKDKPFDGFEFSQDEDVIEYLVKNYITEPGVREANEMVTNLIAAAKNKYIDALHETMGRDESADAEIPPVAIDIKLVHEVLGVPDNDMKLLKALHVTMDKEYKKLSELKNDLINQYIKYFDENGKQRTGIQGAPTKAGILKLIQETKDQSDRVLQAQMHVMLKQKDPKKMEEQRTFRATTELGTARLIQDIIHEFSKLDSKADVKPAASANESRAAAEIFANQAKELENLKAQQTAEQQNADEQIKYLEQERDKARRNHNLDDKTRFEEQLNTLKSEHDAKITALQTNISRLTGALQHSEGKARKALTTTLAEEERLMKELGLARERGDGDEITRLEKLLESMRWEHTGASAAMHAGLRTSRKGDVIDEAFSYTEHSLDEPSREGDQLVKMPTKKGTKTLGTAKNPSLSVEVDAPSGPRISTRGDEPYTGVTFGFNVVQRMRKEAKKNKSPKLVGEKYSAKEFDEICQKEIDKIAKMKKLSKELGQGDELQAKLEAINKQVAAGPTRTTDEALDLFQTQFKNSTVAKEYLKADKGGKYSPVTRFEHKLNTIAMYETLKAKKSTTPEGDMTLQISENNVDLLSVTRKKTGLVDIVADQGDPSDKALLQMVLFAGRCTKSGRFNINDCETDPTSAIKLYLFGRSLDLEPQLKDDKTRKAIEEYLRKGSADPHFDPRLATIYDEVSKNSSMKGEDVLNRMDDWQKDQLKKRDDTGRRI